MAIIKNLYIDQGTTFAASITVTNAVLSTALELENSQIYAQIRKSSYSNNITATFHCSYIAETKQIVIYMTPEETAAVYPGRYEYDILAVDTNRNTTIKIMGGIVHFDATTTKING